ncbi:MAG: hypothetical protein QM795_16185 [Pseudoxanthomonas sp.]
MTSRPTASPVRPTAMLAACLSLAACTTTPATPAWVPGQQATVEGQVATVDTTPWTYDGSAVVTLATPTGNVDVHLPARWNLCKAPPPDDVQALKAGDRVRVTGTVSEPHTLVVCEQAAHGLHRAP